MSCMWQFAPTRSDSLIRLSNLLEKSTWQRQKLCHLSKGGHRQIFSSGSCSMPDSKLHIIHVFIHHSLSTAVVTNMSKLQSSRVCVLSQPVDSWLDGLQLQRCGQMDQFCSGRKGTQKKSNAINYQAMLEQVALSFSKSWNQARVTDSN